MEGLQTLVVSIVAGWIRHGLTIAGAALVTKGLLDTTTAANLETNVAVAAIGVATAAVGLGWSALNKLLTSKFTPVLAAVKAPVDKPSVFERSVAVAPAAPNSGVSLLGGTAASASLVP